MIAGARGAVRGFQKFDHPVIAKNVPRNEAVHEAEVVVNFLVAIEFLLFFCGEGSLFHLVQEELNAILDGG